MISRSVRTLSLLALTSLPIVLSAQETSGKEDERLQALSARNAEEEQWFGPRNKVSVGFRILNSGGTVNFGNLGAVPQRTIAAASEGAVTRIYDTGTVSRDGLRTDEVDANGNQTSTPGGRYQVFTTLDDGSKQLYSDQVSYTPGQTRIWTVLADGPSDRAGYAGFNAYSTVSEGGHMTDKQGPSGGVELQFAREMGRLSRRVQWGLTSGVVLNSINSKVAGAVTSTLVTYTDYYKILGGYTSIMGAPASGPVYNSLLDANGVELNSTGLETTVPLSQTPDSSLAKTVATAGGATVNGRWQVKGAYLLFKLGPSFKTQFTDRLELSGSVGLAGAYAGTQYTATETLRVDALPDTDVGVSDPQSSTASKFLKGFYADLTLEWAANDATAIFGGLTAQQLDDYEQKVADRIAHIDLGSTVGVRGGISIRF